MKYISCLVVLLIAAAIHTGLLVAPSQASDFLVEKAKISSSVDGIANGVAVALADSGDTLLIAGWIEISNPVGVCWTADVFVADGSGNWILQQRLMPPDPAACAGTDGSLSGFALSGDGNTVIVGHAGVNSAGVAYIFVRDQGLWSHQTTLAPVGGGAQDVALSDDGNTALVTGATDDVLVYQRSGVTWTKEAGLNIAGSLSGTNLAGHLIALSGDGQTALIGAAFTDCSGPGSQCGAGHIFRRSGTSWSLQSVLTSADLSAGDYLGSTVALSANGNTALLGAMSLQEINNCCGSVYVFVRSGTTWNEQQKLTVTEATPFYLFGSDVALSDSGGVALIGARGARCAGDKQCGRTHVYERASGFWTLRQNLTGSGGESTKWFGASVALRGDVSMALVGSAGAGYVFELKCGGFGYLLQPDCFRRPYEIPNWIILGCAVVDCCPGCPDDQRLDWLIRVDGDPVDYLVLRFENLDDAVRRRLRIGKSARWIGRDRLRISGNMTTIRGFPGWEGFRGTAGSPRVTLESAVWQRSARAVTDDGRGGSLADRTVRLRIEQRVGQTPIENGTLLYGFN